MRLSTGLDVVGPRTGVAGQVREEDFTIIAQSDRVTTVTDGVLEGLGQILFPGS